MSADVVHGLACPRCGGMVAAPEGQALVICPFCDQRSVVSAERENGSPEGGAGYGIRRYQAPLRINREGLEQIFRGFVSGKVQVARDCAAKAVISEVFLVHLPFWTVWARGVAWAFGKEKVGSGDDARYEPRERRAVSELNWNAPACEVGEFGVQRVSLDGRPLEPFEPDGLHRSGMVFDPLGSSVDAFEAARQHFEAKIASQVKLDRAEQTFTRLTNKRIGLVYYPLWVMRYLYRGRSFQVVVDGYDGQVLYGKAPGSVAYRAGVLVGGMALGALLAVDGPAWLLSGASSSDDDFPLGAAFAALAFGVIMMLGAYRIFRKQEHYEYQRYKALAGAAGGGKGLVEGLTGSLSLNAQQIENIAKHLKDFQ